MQDNIMVWGLGNPLQGDDRAGIEVTRELLQREAPGILPVVCETTPGNFVPLVQRERPGTLVLVDAADMGLPPGTIRLIPPEKLEEISFTSHDLSLDLMLRSVAGETSILLIGIQPERVELALELTSSVRTAVEQVVQVILERNWAALPTVDASTR